eukprot:TRINITY_DN11819_c2_g1_i1.p2 TRINITY_DN11819_c2_g1~~TRINITY_DN11819_c2_g1_i1.p2  ORF type:complete len:316 (+),score=33.21 TRINITY_DN11819_c2_g1_i1:155-1102(+)
MPEIHGSFVRRNGWERPWNGQQIGAWVVISYFMVVYYGAIAPAFAERWQPFAYFTPSFFLLTHVGLLFVCTTMDPADRNVRYDTARPTTIDRSQRKHVIMNQQCYFCQVQVSKTAKHCSACNKCVSEFDHHCRWMNNCVGGRTYRLFFTSIAAGSIGVVMLAACIIYLIAALYGARDHHHLSLTSKREVQLFGHGVSDGAFMAVMIISLLLSFLAGFMLIQLTGFHISLMSKGMSTYDFIKEQRAKANAAPDAEKGPTSARCCGTSKNKVAPKAGVESTSPPSSDRSANRRLRLSCFANGMPKRSLEGTPEDSEV